MQDARSPHLVAEAGARVTCLLLSREGADRVDLDVARVHVRGGVELDGPTRVRRVGEARVRAGHGHGLADVGRGGAGLFPDDWPKPIVSNMIDVAAKDFSDNLGPLPSFEARSANTASDRAKKFSDKRTKIINNYVSSSNLQAQMYGGADRLMSYG